MSNLNIRSLFASLPENPSRKLISFADSRDRAARLALNVATSHREQAVAESVLIRAEDLTKIEPELLRRHESGLPRTEKDLDFISRYRDGKGNPSFLHEDSRIKNLENNLDEFLSPFGKSYKQAILDRGPASNSDKRLLFQLNDALESLTQDQYPSLTKHISPEFPPEGEIDLPPLARDLLLQGSNPAGFHPRAIEPISSVNSDESWMEVLGGLRKRPPRAKSDGWEIMKPMMTESVAIEFEMFPSQTELALLPDTLDELFGGDTLTSSLEHDRGAMRILGANIIGFVSPQALKAGPDIGLNVLHQMAQMDGAVGVGESACGKNGSRHLN